MNGVLVIDKPAGMTSHDVVNRIRRITKERSVGHLGTLDPMATGVLPLVLGRLTRLAQFYTASAKRYEGEIRFGFATTTYDAEGDPLGDVIQGAELRLTLDGLREAAARFRGSFEQMPPQFSAKKIRGVPAYKLARNQGDVQLKAVPVEVHELEIQALDGDRARFHASVSAGTYMRSIAHDLGHALGVGAHLASLRRTASGEFDIADAHTFEDLERAIEIGGVDDVFVHPRRILPQMPCVTATEEAVAMIRHGRAVNLPELSRARMVKVFRGQRELIAIASRIAGSLFQPKVVFASN